MYKVDPKYVPLQVSAGAFARLIIEHNSDTHCRKDDCDDLSASLYFPRYLQSKKSVVSSSGECISYVALYQFHLVQSSVSCEASQDNT